MPRSPGCAPRSREAAAELAGDADEGVTWRLRAAAEAAHDAMRTPRPRTSSMPRAERRRVRQRLQERVDRSRSGRNRDNADAHVANHSIRERQPHRPARRPPARAQTGVIPMAAKDTEPKKPEEHPDGAGPMLDMSQAAVKKMIATAKARGYITYDELNEVLPPDQVTSEQIEDVMAMLSEMGINVIENDEADEEDGAPRRRPRARPSEGGSRELADRPRSAARRSTAPTTRCACTCARWARSSSCRARARSPSPSASRPAATR